MGDSIGSRLEICETSVGSIGMVPRFHKGNVYVKGSYGYGEPKHTKKNKNTKNQEHKKKKKHHHISMLKVGFKYGFICLIPSPRGRRTKPKSPAAQDTFQPARVTERQELPPHKTD